MKTRWPLAISSLLFLGACSSMYYGTMEKFGVHKRDIMVDRVKAARDSQNAAGKQFTSALEQFKSVVNFQGGNLEKEYNKLNATLQKSESAAAAVHDRIRSVEDVSKALFKEWHAELKQYRSDTLRRASQRQYDLTLAKYEDLMAAMKKAESKLEPALVPLRDEVLFLKHNLNAKAIAGLSDELAGVQTNVDALVGEMAAAVAKADAFIAALQTQ